MIQNFEQGDLVTLKALGEGCQVVVNFDPSNQIHDVVKAGEIIAAIVDQAARSLGCSPMDVIEAIEAAYDNDSFEFRGIHLDQ